MAKLSVLIVGNASSLQAALDSASESASGFSGKMTAVGSSIAGVGKKMSMDLTLPIVAVGAASTDMAMKFQRSMELLNSQAHVSQAGVQQFSRAILDMAGSVGTTPTVLAEAAYHIASVGIKGQQAFDVLRIAAEGAKVGMSNLTDTTNALDAVVVSKIGGVQNYTQAMGALNGIVGSGDMSMQNLADAMGTGVLASAKVFGVSLQQVGGALATFGDNNIRGSAAARLLMSTMRVMGAPSIAASKALAGVGLGATQLAGDMRQGGLIQAFDDLKKHMEAAGLSASQQALLITRAFGGRQATGVMILLSQLERLQSKTDEVGKSANTFGADWAATTQTAAFKLDAMGAAASAAGISIGNVLLPIVMEIVDKVTDWINAFQSLSPQMQQIIEISAGVAAAIGPVLAVIGAVVTAVGLLLSPIGAAVAAFALLTGGIALAVLAPQKLEDALEKMGLSATTSARIVSDLQGVFHDLQNAVGVVADYIEAHWSQIESAIESASNAIVQVAEQAWPKIQSIIEGVGQIITAVVSVIEALWKEFGSNIAEAAEIAWNLIKSTIQNALEVIEGVVDVFAGILHGNWGEVWEGIKDIFSGVWDEIEAIAKAAVGIVGDALNALGKAAEVILGKAWALMKSGAKDAWNGIKLVFFNAGTWFEEIGKALMDGLAKGLEDAAEEVYGALRSVGDKVKSIAHDIFKVASPSLVFDNIGQMLMAGLAQGIDTATPTALASLKASLAKTQQALDEDAPTITAAAKLLGGKATEGVIAGIVGVQQTTAQQIKTALVSAMQPGIAQAAAAPEIEQATKMLGSKQAQSVVDGVIGVQASMTSQLKTALTAAMQPALAQAATAPEVTAAAKILGAKQAAAVVAGVVGAQPSMTQQIKTALSSAVSAAMTQAQQAAATATSSFESSFGSMASGILSAFSDQTSAYVAPAQKQLNAEQLQDQVAQYTSAVSTAKSTLTADQAALTTAMAGGDPATIASAQAQVLSDQQAFTAAQRALQEFNLQQLAAKQTAAYNKARAKQEESLALQLADLEKGLAKEPGQWDTMTAKVDKILKTYGVTLVASGQRFVQSFADGITNAIPTAVAAAKAMAQAVADYTKLNSPAKLGPLSTLDKWWAPFAPTILQGLNIPALSSAMGSMAMPMIPSGALGGGGGGNTTINVTVPNGFVGDNQQLVTVLSNAFVTAGRQGHPLWRKLV